ncbi:MAG: hypothetical protein RXP91_04475, partial [Nitrososphaeria archaeon]
WARALGSVGWTVPPRGRRPVAVDEAAEKANGREVCAWAAMDVDTGELPAIKATRSRGSMDAPLPGPDTRGLQEQTGVRRGGGPRYSCALRELGLERRRGALGDGSGVERSFGSLKGGRGSSSRT